MHSFYDLSSLDNYLSRLDAAAKASASCSRRRVSGRV